MKEIVIKVPDDYKSRIASSWNRDFDVRSSIESGVTLEEAIIENWKEKTDTLMRGKTIQFYRLATDMLLDKYILALDENDTKPLSSALQQVYKIINEVEVEMQEWRMSEKEQE